MEGVGEEMVIEPFQAELAMQGLRSSLSVLLTSAG
jgi:hypothetical protein